MPLRRYFVCSITLVMELVDPVTSVEVVLAVAPVDDTGSLGG
jgi:hypothetical protein